LPKKFLVLSTPQAGGIHKPIHVFACSSSRITAPVVLDRLIEPTCASASLVLLAKVTAGGRSPAHIPRVILGRGRGFLFQDAGCFLIATNEK
jgi:hypothetical protein